MGVVITDRSFKKKKGGEGTGCVRDSGLLWGDGFFFPSTSSQRVLKSLCATINLGIDPFAKNQAKWRESEEGDEDISLATRDGCLHLIEDVCCWLWAAPLARPSQSVQDLLWTIEECLVARERQRVFVQLPLGISQEGGKVIRNIVPLFRKEFAG